MNSTKNTEKDKKSPLIGDLARFKHKRITITFVDGKSVYGMLLGYDDIANCVIERLDGELAGKMTVCLGRSIILISLGSVQVIG